MSAAKRRKIQDNSHSLLQMLAVIQANPPPPRPKQKVFKPKCPEVMVLRSYGGSAPETFWKSFPVNRNIHGKSPFVMDGDRLLELAVAAGVDDMSTVKAVANDIKFGCDLKVDASKCKPTRSSNAPSAKKEGRKVTDALAMWVKSGIACGPFLTCPKNAVVNGLQTAPKPNGTVRIIVNQSAPKGGSVNDCLDKKAYPSYMGATKELLRALNYNGPGCKFCKVEFLFARMIGLIF